LFVTKLAFLLKILLFVRDWRNGGVTTQRRGAISGHRSKKRWETLQLNCTKTSRRPILIGMATGAGSAENAGPENAWLDFEGPFCRSNGVEPV